MKKNDKNTYREHTRYYEKVHVFHTSIDDFVHWQGLLEALNLST